MEGGNLSSYGQWVLSDYVRANEDSFTLELQGIISFTFLADGIIEFPGIPSKVGCIPYIATSC